jgi:hypothetical protein
MGSLSLTRPLLTAFAPLSASLSHRGLGGPIRCLIEDKSKLQNHPLQLTKRTKLSLSGNSFLECIVDRKPKNQITGLVSSSAAGSEPDSLDSSNALQPILSSLNAFYRFSRPHTIIGTALSIVSVSLLAVESSSDVSSLFFTGVLQALVAALFMNVYIVGLNQVFDIEIDKVNKPNLPLASGEYSLSTGVAIVSTFVILVTLVPLYLSLEILCTLFCIWFSNTKLLTFLFWFHLELWSRLVGWFMAIVLGSFHQFYSWHCLLDKYAFLKMEEICSCSSTVHLSRSCRYCSTCLLSSH